MDVVTITLLPEGYRWIRKGEIIKEGDLHSSTYTHKWEMIRKDDRLKLEKAMASNVYIRKIS